jgi:thiamine biosynthesis lipoprotein
MSVNIADSDVSRINGASGIAPVRVHDDVFTVIERALYFARLSEGAFDPTVEPLVFLWDIGGDNQRVPSQIEIMLTLPLVNWQDVELDAEEKTVFLKRKGMGLDLGAIAKGYAADEAAAIIARRGIKRAIIDLGGNIIVYGEKADKSPWRVGIQHPLDERGAYIGVLQIAAGTNKTIVTSGVNERYFTQDGKRYHHIFSPATGFPADTGLLSVTIIADNSMDADGLSTAAFVLGWEKGSALIESLPGTEAVFIFEDLSVKKTDGAEFSKSP